MNYQPIFQEPPHLSCLVFILFFKLVEKRGAYETKIPLMYHRYFDLGHYCGGNIHYSAEPGIFPADGFRAGKPGAACR
jgi:hypothetical protein